MGRMEVSVKTDVERLEKNKVLLNIEVPSERLQEAIAEAYKRIAAKASVPGFRKGRIPKDVIDTRIGKGHVYQEALNLGVPRYYAEAVQESGLEPIANPDFEVVQIEDGKPLKFKATVEVKPDVKLGKYKGVKAKRPSTRVTEKEIDVQLEELRERFATLDAVDGRKLRQGDFALIDFEGFVGDEPIQGGAATDYLLEIGSKTFVPGVEDQLVGMSVGEERTVVTTMPADYHAQQIVGKEVVFKVRLTATKDKRYPELDDAFAEQVGGFDTLAKLREDLKERLKNLKEMQAEIEVKEQVLTKVGKEAKVEVPETMINDQTADMLRDLATSLTQQGIGIEQYLESRKMTIQELRDSLKPDAETRVRNQLVLESIGREEGLEPTPEEIDNEIASVARGINKEFEEVKRTFVARGAIPVVREQLIARKALDWITKHADAGTKQAAEAKTKTKAKAKAKTKTKYKAKAKAKVEGSSGVEAQAEETQPVEKPASEDEATPEAGVASEGEAKGGES